MLQYHHLTLHILHPTAPFKKVIVIITECTIFVSPYRQPNYQRSHHIKQQHNRRSGDVIFFCIKKHMYQINVHDFHTEFHVKKFCIITTLTPHLPPPLFCNVCNKHHLTIRSIDIDNSCYYCSLINRTYNRYHEVISLQITKVQNSRSIKTEEN